LLAEVGESIKTAQALLGHSDLETTLNTYAHAIPSSQRRAVDRVAEVLFSNVLNFGINRNGSRSVVNGLVKGDCSLLQIDVLDFQEQCLVGA